MSVFQRYQAEFAGHLRDPGACPPPSGTSRRGMAIYAELVFNAMDGTLSACFPVCRKVLGARRWRRLIRDFLAQHRCTTPIFRQIPEELLRWLEDAPAAVCDLPPFFASLAHYEWVELAVATSDALPEGMPDPEGDLLAGKPVLAPSLMLLQYAWPVHRISPRFKPTETLARPVHLLVFRDPQDEVRFIEINPASARLVGLLQEGGRTGRQALEWLATELQHPDPQAMVRFGAELLEVLKRQGAVWGARQNDEAGQGGAPTS